MKTRLAINVLVVAILLISCLIASAQTAPQTVIGTPSMGSLGGGPFDVVNLGNLNVHFSIPIRHKAGRGTPFSYDLVYDSSVWAPVGTSGSQVWTPVNSTGTGNVGSYWGWQGLSKSGVSSIAYTLTVINNTQCGQFSNQYFYGWEYGNFVYYDKSGAHFFPSTGGGYFVNYCPAGSGPPNGPVGNTTAAASDGSGLTINLAYGAGSVSASLTTKSGATINAPVVSNPSGQQGSYSSADSNGNQITLTNGVYTDTLGQTALTVLGTEPSNTTLSYAAPSGATATYTVSYKAYTVKTNFGCSGVTEYNQANIYLVDKITLPDTTQYTFGYEATAGGSGQVTGRLASVTLPTGGTVSYTYAPTSGGKNGINCSDGSAPAISGQPSLARELNPGGVSPSGTWNYTRTLVSGSHWQTKVTDPAGNDTVIDFQKDGATNPNTYNLYETQRQAYQGSQSSNILLITTTRCYNGNYSNCTTTNVSSPISQTDSYRQLTNGNALSQVQYNSSGLVTDDKKYNFGVALNAAPSSTYLVRETSTRYGSATGSSGCTALGNGIVNLLCRVIVYDWSSGSAVTLASSSYTYDGTSVTNTSGTPQHISVTGSRGNLTTASSQVNSTTTLSRTITYYDTGTPNVATDVNGAQTTYQYGSGSCGNSFPTTINEPLSLSRTITWNCIGAVTTNLKDENGNNASSSYTDTDFWRPYSVTDQVGNQSNLSYSAQTAVEAALQSFNGGLSASDSRTTVDGFGRTVFTQRLQAPSGGNYDTSEIDYNSLGQPYRSTMPYTASASPTTNNTTVAATNTTYDALGRVLTVTDADSGTVTYAYTGNDVLQKISGPSPTQAFQKQFEYDGLGRLTSVCEISTTLPGSGTCGQTTSQSGYWTKYTYDALGHLLTVKQNAQAASGSQQNRSFTYDMLGRMLTESNPETANSNGNGGQNGTISYTYDSISSGNCAGSFPGDLIMKGDAAGNTSCYTYDARHRTVQIIYPSGPNATATPAKYFGYDTLWYGAGGANLAGRLVAAVTCQTNISCAGNAVSRTIFGYSARGEVTDVWENSPHSAGTYHITASFWPTGTMKTLSGIPGVPTIYYGTNASGANFLDGEGRYLEVAAASGTSPVTAVTYSTGTPTAPLGALTGLTLGSADSDTFTYDPNTGRMATYTFSVNGKTDAGTLTWNSNGTLQKLVVNDQIPGTSDSQNCTYAYDDIRRLSNVSCGIFWVQNFTYDPFGNITKNVPGGDGGLTFLPSYWTSPPTNQFTSLPGVTVAYDGNGNLLTDNLNTYTWDAAGHPVSVTPTGGPTVNATYDALGRMVENNAGGSNTVFVYGPTGAKLAKCNGQTLVKAFVALPGGAKAIYNSSGVLTYYRHSDWLGSSRLTSTQSRTLYSSSAYAPFGEQYGTSGTADASFTGQDQDTVSNLYDFPARRQSPSQGRWISPDPAGRGAVSLTNPQSWNRYAYVNNNPLSLIDPMGMDAMDPCDPADDTCDGGGGGGGDSSGGDSGGGDNGGGDNGGGDNGGGDNGGNGGAGCTDALTCPPMYEEGDPSQNCAEQCQLQNAEFNALQALMNGNCANFLGLGGQASSTLLNMMTNSFVLQDTWLGDTAGTISAQPLFDPTSSNMLQQTGVAYSSGGAASIFINTSGDFFDAGGSAAVLGLDLQTYQSLVILHELGHAVALNGGISGVVPDSADETGSEGAATLFSHLNTLNVMDNCFPGSGAQDPGGTD